MFDYERKPYLQRILGHLYIYHHKTHLHVWFSVVRVRGSADCCQPGPGPAAGSEGGGVVTRHRAHIAQVFYSANYLLRENYGDYTDTFTFLSFWYEAFISSTLPSGSTGTSSYIPAATWSTSNQILWRRQQQHFKMTEFIGLQKKFDAP